MRSMRQDLPVLDDVPAGTLRRANWGEMTVETGVVRETFDASPLFKGLPGDSCQCSHWGYVLTGRMRFMFADHEEVYSAGELYYAPPGHTPVFEAGCEYVEFTHTDELNKTMEFVELNMNDKS